MITFTLKTYILVCKSVCACVVQARSFCLQKTLVRLIISTSSSFPVLQFKIVAFIWNGKLLWHCTLHLKEIKLIYQGHIQVIKSDRRHL